MANIRIVLTCVCACLVMPAAVGISSAQSLGPVTGNVGTADPTNASLRLGPFQMSTGVAIQSIGVDNNVFDEAVDPKRDWHAVISPDMSLYLRTGWLRFTLASAADFTYYAKYKSERGMNRSLRGRLELLLSRFRPFLAAGTVQTRERPNSEIDLRARRTEREVVAGVSFELSPQTFAYVGGSRTDYFFNEGEVFRGIELRDQLDRRNESVSIGIKRDLTPLTSVEIRASSTRDRFTSVTLRNSDAASAQTIWTFAPDALFRGELTVGFQHFNPQDPLVKAYDGVTLGGRIFWPVFGSMRLDIGVDRRLQYSFEEKEPYFVQTGLDLTVTQHLIGRFDVQARGGHEWLNYGQTALPESGDPSDKVLTGLIGVGYTLSESRFGFNYEYRKRDSDRSADRIYDRHRVFGSWTYNF